MSAAATDPDPVPPGESVWPAPEPGEELLDPATVNGVFAGLDAVLLYDTAGEVMVAESLRRIIAAPAGVASWTAVAELAEKVTTPYQRKLLARAWRHLARHAGDRAYDAEMIVDADDTAEALEVAARAEAIVTDELESLRCADLAAAAPGPDLIARLTETDPWTLPGRARVDVLKAWQRASAWLEAHRLETVAAIETSVISAAGERYEHSIGSQAEIDEARTSGVIRAGRDTWVVEELAVALTLTPRAAGVLRRRADKVIWGWPGLKQAMLAGEVDTPRAEAIIDELRDAGAAPAWETLLGILPDAATLTTPQLRQRIRRDLIRLDPTDAAAQRDHAAKRDTGIRRRRHRHGLGTLEITAPAADIEALHARIDATRVAMDRAAAEIAQVQDAPTLGQRRIAALLALVGLAPLPTESGTGTGNDEATDPAGPPRPGVAVHVVVDLPTLLGLANNPAHLPGYGPIDPALARALAADGEWTRWVSDPVTGHLLDEGRRRFAGDRLAAYLKARDGTCTTAFCASPATDADHLPGYARGTPTAAATMGGMCAHHNRGRLAAGWEAVIAADTSITYRTALGQDQVVAPRAVLPTDEPPPF